MNVQRRLPDLKADEKTPPWKVGRYRLTLRVADLDRSVTFYRDILRFWPVWRNATTVCLTQDNLELLLDRKERPKKPLQGIRIGFSVSRNKDLDIWAVYLETRRVHISSAPKNTDCGRNLVFLDPDGYPIEVHWEST